MRDVLLQQSSRTAWLTALLCLLWTATFSQTQNPPTNPPQNPPANVAQNTPPGQEPENRLEIISTKVFRFGHFGKDSIKIRKLLGNVHLRQDTTDFLCDTAYQYIDSNYVEAWSNVRINMKNGRTITANRLTYNGRTKILNLYGRVVLEDSTVKLETERLTYYRIPDYGYYPTPGKVTTGENILTSERGFYYPSREMAYFKDSVKLKNPDFDLETDTLGYNTKLETAYFLAPTYVYDSSSSMYTEDGYYDTKNDYALLHTNARIGDTTYTMYADTITFDKRADLGTARRNIRVVQADSGMTIFGQYGEFKSKTEETYITDSTFAIQFFEDDTLYLFADTLATIEDTVEDQKIFMAYYKTSFFMKDMQGIADSLAYYYDDSLLYFYHFPALWSDDTQLTGDTIMIGLNDGDVDTMSIPAGPFIVTQEDTVGFDQIKGKALSAKFKDNDLEKMWVKGNSESIYWTKDEDEDDPNGKENAKYIGMNRAKCTDMFIKFEDNKPTSILFEDKPEGEFFPYHMVFDKANQLEGFIWREKERPTRPGWVVDILAPPPVDSLQLQLDSVIATLDSIDFMLKILLSEQDDDDNGDLGLGDDSLGGPLTDVGSGDSDDDSLSVSNDSRSTSVDSDDAPDDSLSVPKDSLLSPKDSLALVKGGGGQSGQGATEQGGGQGKPWKSLRRSIGEWFKDLFRKKEKAEKVAIQSNRIRIKSMKRDYRERKKRKKRAEKNKDAPPPESTNPTEPSAPIDEGTEEGPDK